MQDAFQLKRIFAVVTIAAMVLGSLSAVLTPSTASAAEVGGLIKSESLSTVYYYAPDGTRYIFPNEKTYFTWYTDFSGVETISDSALADIALGGNVVYRPGSYWVKITSNPNVYAVSTDGTILHIGSAEVAEDYAGSDWASNIHDVPDVFFSDYTEGLPLESAVAYDGMMYMDGSDYVLSWGGEKQVVTSAGRTANNMKSAFFLDGASIDDSALTSGASISSEVSALTDASQQGGVEEVVATGDVTVKLSSSNPAGTTVPYNTNMVEVLSFDLTAGSQAAEVDQIAISMVGLSASTDVSDVYLFEGNTRLTEARSVNSSTRKATFGSLNIDLSAHETRTITVHVTLNASGGEEIQFGLVAASDIDADGDVSGSFPINGNVFEASTQVAGTLVFDAYGTIDNPSLGQNDAIIGKFKITTATEGGDVQALTLKVDNGADHSDYKLWVDDVVISTGEYIGDKLVAFDFDEEINIAKGKNEVFTLTADIGGEAADTIYVYIDKAIDVTAIGTDYGFPMNAATVTEGDSLGIDQYNNSTSTDERSSSTILGGDVTFALSGPTAGDIRTNSNDQVLLEFTLTTVQDITIKDLDIIVGAEDDGNNNPFTPGDDSGDDNDGLINTGAEGNVSDIKLVNAETGETVMGPLELDCITVVCGAAGTQDGAQTIDFTDDFEMEAGETLTLQVVVDVDDTVTTGTALGATVDISGFVAEDTNGDTLTNATDVVPSADITGYAQTARSASLTMSLASTPTDFTTIQGMSDVNVVDFNLVAGDSGDVEVTDVMFSIYGDADGSGTSTIGGVTGTDVNDFVSSCSIYDINDVLLDGPESPASNGQTLTFSNVNWTLGAGETQKIQLVCNFANPSDAGPDYFTFDIADASEDIDTQDDEGTDVDPLTSAGAAADALNGGTTLASAVIVTVNAAGTIAVTADSGTPSADFVLTNTTDNHVASYRITATNEAFRVKTFTVSEEQGEDNDVDVDDVTPGSCLTTTCNDSGYANNISLVTIEYPLEDGTTGSATATMNGNEAKFSLATAPIYVTTDDPATVDVYVNVPVIDRNAGGSATSGEKVRMGFFVDATNDDNYSAVGVGSGSTLDDDDVSAVGDELYSTDGIATFVVKETMPTVSLSSLSPSGTKVPGDQEVYRFNVSASANEDVIIHDFAWKLSSTDNESSATPWNCWDPDAGLAGDDIQTSDFDLYNLTTTGIGTALDDDAEWTFLEGATTADLAQDAQVDYVQLEFSTDAEALVVPAGTTYTFALYFDSMGASSTNHDTIQFTLVGSTEFSTWVNPTVTINDPAITIADTALILSAVTGITEGDQLCLSGADTTCDATEEIVLVTSVDTLTVTLVRGYLGRDMTLPVTAQNILRRPDSFYWEDDGTAGLTAAQQGWGSYLVDSLPITGGAIQF
ncbi:hypothetical protein KJ673_02170 [Patescibacteria group bacterium]|nr:hypothetical protein [Patescibacteria group bacterium]MCG2687356.1 hypothetical protein [Candidatus Parcubacteria bacterium]